MQYCPLALQNYKIAYLVSVEYVDGSQVYFNICNYFICPDI